MSVDAFRQSEEFAAFMKRWNLTVYFSLRFQVRLSCLSYSLLASRFAVEWPGIFLQTQLGDGVQRARELECIDRGASLQLSLQECGVAYDEEKREGGL